MDIKKLNLVIQKAESYIIKKYVDSDNKQATHKVYVNGDTINLVDNILNDKIEVTEGYVLKVLYNDDVNAKGQKEPNVYATLEKDFNDTSGKKVTSVYFPLEAIAVLEELTTKSNQSKSDIISSLILDLKSKKLKNGD